MFSRESNNRKVSAVANAVGIRGDIYGGWEEQGKLVMTSTCFWVLSQGLFYDIAIVSLWKIEY